MRTCGVFPIVSKMLFTLIILLPVLYSEFMIKVFMSLAFLLLFNIGCVTPLYALSFTQQKNLTQKAGGENTQR